MYAETSISNGSANAYGPKYTKLWAFRQTMVNHFWQSVDAILENVSVTETIV